MDSVIDILFSGGMTTSEYIIFTLIGYAGATLALVQSYGTRSKKQSQPPKFDISYWWPDNKYRVLRSLVLIPLFIMLTDGDVGMEWDKTTALSIGYYSDNLLEVILKRFVRKSSSPDSTTTSVSYHENTGDENDE